MTDSAVEAISVILLGMVWQEGRQQMTDQMRDYRARPDGKIVEPPEPICIFSGEKSRAMWDEINSALSVDDLKDALYTVCVKLQELESKLNRVVVGERK